MRFWLGMLTVGVVAEIVAINRSRGGKDRGTLTHTLRLVFRTDTTTGRAVFLLALGGGSAWIASQILNTGAPTHSPHLTH